MRASDKATLGGVVQEWLTRVWGTWETRGARKVGGALLTLPLLLLAVPALAAPPVITSVEVASFTTDNTTSVALPQTNIPSLIVWGTDFFPSSPGPLITIRRAGFPDVQRISGNINGGTAADGWVIVKNVDLSAYPPGSFDVVVTRAPSNPGSATMTEAFSLLPHGPATLQSRGAWGGPINHAHVEEGRIVLGSGRRLVVLNSTDESNLVELGSIDLKRTVVDVEVRGDHAFVCASEGGSDGWFGVVDITNPANPTLVWDAEHVTITGVGKVEGVNVEVEGNTAYVQTGSRLIRFSISNPAAPSYITGVLSPSGINTYEIENGVLYALHDLGGSKALRIYDLSSGSSSPPLLGSLVLVTGDGILYGMSVRNGMVLVTRRTPTPTTHTFVMVDATNPAAPVVRSSTQIPSGHQARCALLPGLALIPEEEYSGPQHGVGDDFRGLLVYDISDPASPTLIANVKTHGSVYGAVTATQNDRAYILDHGEGLIVLDMANPASPVRKGGFYSPSTPRGMAAKTVQGQDQLLFVSDLWNGLTVLDVEDPARSRVLGVYQTPGTDMQEHSGIAYHDGLVYLAAGYGGIDVVDVADPTMPTCVHNFSFMPLFPGATYVRTAGLELDGGILRVGVMIRYPGVTSYMLWNLDASNPLALTPIGSTYVPFLLTKIQTVAGVTHAICHASGPSSSLFTVATIDNTAPASPVLSMPSTSVGPANDFQRIGDLLYVSSAKTGGVTGSNLDGITMWNVADPAQPILLGSFDQNAYLAGSSADRFTGLTADTQTGEVFAIGSFAGLTGKSGPALALLEPMSGEGGGSGGTNPNALRFVTDAGERIGSTRTAIDDATSGLLVTPGRVYAAHTNDTHPGIGWYWHDAHGVVIVERLPPAPPPCPADYNADGGVDVLDFLDFLDDFGACEQQPTPCGSHGPVDLNGDTFVDVLDFLEFLDAFGSGC